MSENTQLAEAPPSEVSVVEGEVTELRAMAPQQHGLAGALMEGQQLHRRSSSLEVAIAEAKAKAISDRFTAREYKRDLNEAWADIKPACEDPAFALKALSRREDAHELNASIRLLEHVAVNYGNLAYGIRMFSRDEQQTEVEVWAIDKQKGSDFSDSFIVLHEQQAGDKVVKVWKPIKVTDLVNAEISKRLRKGLGKMVDPVILRRAVDLCKATCNKALEDLESHKRLLLEKFTESYGVDKSGLQAFLKKPWDKVERKDLQKLYSTYAAIREGETTLKDVFPNAKGDKVASDAPPMVQQDKEEKPSKDEKKTTKPAKSQQQSTTQSTSGDASTATASSDLPATTDAQDSAPTAEANSSAGDTKAQQQEKKPEAPKPPIKKLDF